jgi:DNA polymerase-3 subunit epsilon
VVAVVLHQDYLRALARAAWENGVVTEDERADLLTVARLLGLTASDVDNALHLARESKPGPRPSTVTKFTLQPGDQIVLTGEMTRPRPELEALARQAGLAVHGNITKKTRLLIAADPDSLSGKARNAQTYGIPIIGEPAFVGMISNMAR